MRINLDAECLDEAIDRALAILKARPRHHSIEIWQGAFRLYVSREQAPRHQCYIYEGSPSHTLPAMAAVIQRKLNENSRCMYLNSPPMVTGLKFYLTSAGMDVEGEIAKGSLVLSSDRQYINKGVFDADLMLGMLEDAVDGALREGYSGLWASGDMTWELGPQQSATDLLQYEWRLEEIFRRRPALSGICQYHLDTLPRDAVKKGLQAHPSIFVNETLSCINPHYTRPHSEIGQNGKTGELDEFISRLSRSDRPPL